MNELPSRYQLLKQKKVQHITVQCSFSKVQVNSGQCGTAQ